jgi:3-hydroxyacyl-CoA dehydrogenase
MVLEHHRDGAIAVVTLAHAPVNALNLALRRGLYDFFTAVRSDAAIAAIVVQGAGKGFCAGGDRTEFGTQDANARPTLSRDVLDSIERCGKPVVAALHGFAMGGGFELALACGARIAVASTQVALPEVTIGVFPLSATQRLPRVLGLARAARLMLSGARVDASDPIVAGCFDMIVPDVDSLLPATLTYACERVGAPLVPVRARPFPGDAAAELQQLLAQHPRDARSPAEQALLQALEAAVNSEDFQAGLDRAQRLFDELGGNRRRSPPVQAR